MSEARRLRSLEEENSRLRVTEHLAQLTPSNELFALARMMFDDLWNARLAQAEEQRQSATQQIAVLEKEIEALIGRVIEAENARVIKAYESKIASLETQKLLLAE